MRAPSAGWPLCPFWLDRHGVFGDANRQAVSALQKAADPVPDGVVGPASSARSRGARSRVA
ncbi:MAG: hypothetical protein B7Z69_08080 [Actinobacteria bacterium 21-73-9]|nr:MAG: hypothetical protein B7Z69_08080 [Actinobacteria bacterium 21-73-9]